MTEPITNDFSIRIATPNGTGSQTSNLIIFRSLFHMGLAPSAKNLFPSNIAGLPTWYQIRVSPEGWQARREDWQILLPLNPQTIAQDLRECAPGTVVIDNGDMKGVDESLFEGLERLDERVGGLLPGLEGDRDPGVCEHVGDLAQAIEQAFPFGAAFGNEPRMEGDQIEAERGGEFGAPAAAGEVLGPGLVGPKPASAGDRLERRVVLAVEANHPARERDPAIGQHGGGVRPGGLLEKRHQIELHRFEADCGHRIGVSIEGDDDRALLSESTRGRGADPATGPGHQHDPF